MLTKSLVTGNLATTGIIGNILLVEDDEIVSHTITYSLKKRFYNVCTAKCADTGYKLFMKSRFDACIIDVNLSEGMNGITLTRKIRAKNSQIPIILVSADENVDTKLVGFEAGADDYVTKPVNPLELIGRVNLLLKRFTTGPDVAPTQFMIGDMHFDFSNLLLKYDWMEVYLTEMEATLLRCLCLNPNQLIRRDDLCLKLWGKSDKFVNRSMDVYLSRLRKYLKSQEHISIETIRGVGIKLNIDTNINRRGDEPTMIHLAS